MSRLQVENRLPAEYDRASIASVLRDIQSQINRLSEGNITAVTNASTASPTTGSYQVGDVVRNSNPSELGSASSKYTIFGWVCITAGIPGTWRELRCLTGN